jgi:hypothetical protein
MAVGALGIGDVLVLAERETETRLMFHGIATVPRVHTRGAAHQVLARAVAPLRDQNGTGVLGSTGLLPSYRLLLITNGSASCAAPKMAATAQMAGRKSGRKPKRNAMQQCRARELMSQGQGVRGVRSLFDHFAFALNRKLAELADDKKIGT